MGRICVVYRRSVNFIADQMDPVLAAEVQDSYQSLSCIALTYGGQSHIVSAKRIS